ncbi:hydantoinase B/oxoprolinase family protein, partial [Thermodesulfobacteriota bacterium]
MVSKDFSEVKFKPRVGPIDFEVLRHRLWQTNDEHGRTIINVSGSPVAAEANDFNVSITNAKGEIVCLGTYMAPLIHSISSAIKHAYRLFGEKGIEPDCVYMTNDPWLGAQHQNDVCLIAPIFWEGKLVSWIGSSIHQVDIGGNVEGSWNPQANNVFQEAPLYVFLKVVRQGKVQPEVVATYTRNSRLPHLVELDLRAQIAGINVTKQRLFALIREYGLETTTNVMEDCLDHQEFLLKRKLRQIPDGEWYAEDYLDHDGHQEKLYTVRLKLTKQGDGLIFDYKKSDPQTPGFVNCTKTSLSGKIFLALATHLCNDIPWGGGILRVAHIQSREGSVVDAKYPAPVSGAPVNAGWKVQNTAFLALSKMLSCSERYKENAMAVWVGASFVYNVFGTNQYGKPFGTMMLSSTLGGGGARCFGDGYDNSGPLTSLSPSVINVESAELKTPLLYLYRKRATDSGGAGKYRGGVAALSCITPYDVEFLRIFISTLGTTHSCSIGLEGGYPGGGSNGRLKRKTPIMQLIKEGKFPDSINEVFGEGLTALPSKYMFDFQVGDILETVAHGGGGFGDPLERDPQLVQKDIIDGCVSPEYAFNIYGVVVAPGSKVILASTQARRQELRAERLKAGKSSKPVQNRLATNKGKPIRLGESLYASEGLIRCGS